MSLNLLLLLHVVTCAHRLHSEISCVCGVENRKDGKSKELIGMLYFFSY
jgi:hypothetical protein